jgi:hypothetical protein
VNGERYVTVLQAVDSHGTVQGAVATWGPGQKERRALERAHPGTTIQVHQVEAAGALAKMLSYDDNL